MRAWFAPQRRDPLPGQPLVPPRVAPGRTYSVDANTSLRHSAVWAACRLRADLISTMPLDVYREMGGVRVQVAAPSKLDKPGSVFIEEWLYSSQMDLDRTGNAIGHILGRDAYGLPSFVEWWPADQVTIVWKPGEVQRYRYMNVLYSADEVWHERQYTIPGVPIGLSPVAHAAMTISQYMSAQQFALDWYAGTALPTAVLRNTKRKLLPDEADVIKRRFKASVRAGEPMVADTEWELSPINGVSNDQSWLDTGEASSVEVARFFGVPADMIDAGLRKSMTLTYANITQRNLQFLIMNLGPAIIRREKALSRGWLPRPQFVKFNTDALLRMDPDTASSMLGQQVASHLRTPDEARELLNLPALTPDQWAQFEKMGPVAAPGPKPVAAPPPPVEQGAA